MRLREAMPQKAVILFATVRTSDVTVLVVKRVEETEVRKGWDRNTRERKKIKYERYKKKESGRGIKVRNKSFLGKI
jgi:hypothetical protein